MQFEQLQVHGAYLITPEKREDERGFFARLFCEREFAAHNLQTQFIQMNNSASAKKGTLRGLHYQLAPMEEVKLVRCIKGAIWDLVLDLRPESETFGKWAAEELSAENRKMLYVPKGCAHGFLSLTDDSEMIYLVSEHYCPTLERGVRWNDPRFEIAWPFIPNVISERDCSHADYLTEASL